MNCLKNNVSWCKEHAYYDGKLWRCKKTDEPISVRDIECSLHDGPFPVTGSGNVVVISWLTCEKCLPNEKPPVRGTPVTHVQLY